MCSLSDHEGCSSTAGNRILLSLGCDAEIYELRSVKAKMLALVLSVPKQFFFQTGRPVRRIVTLCLPQIGSLPYGFAASCFQKPQGDR